MKKNILISSCICTLFCILMTGCKSKNGNVWDDTQTVGNYTQSKSFWGNEQRDQGDSFLGLSNEDFIGLKDEDLKVQFTDNAVPQPKHSPGEHGSHLPGINGFQNPTGQAASVFRTLHFNTDDHILRDQQSLESLNRIAYFMQSHPDVYIFVAGHCDERAPESYNLALGTRRANYVRSYLVKQGVDLNRIHTISYGKEHPCNMGHNPDAWKENRRAEFKIYHKQ